MREYNRPICVILGSSRHAKVLIDRLKSSGAARLFAVLDSNESLWGADLQGIPVMVGVPARGIAKGSKDQSDMKAPKVML